MSRTLNHAPMPTEFNPSFAWVAIHCESKFDCTRYPVNAVPTEARKDSAPSTQVSPRRPRQAAMKNVAHKWITMKKKNSSTLHRCRLLKNSPMLEPWYHCGPSSVMTVPDAKATRKAAIVRTPKTYTLSLIHISEPTRLGMISYAVFCLKKK